MNKLLNKYKNGNAIISIFDDGTRITEFPDNEKINLDFPLSIDLCITNYCTRGCLFCYNNSNSKGRHADIMNLKFIDTAPAGMEVAIGGGSATTHPDLIPFLEKLKSKGLVANLTVNQGELIDNMQLVNDLIENDLIHGLGVSFTEPQDLIYKNMEQPNMVVHLIAGVHDKEVFDYLSQFNLKILILGYKDIGRGYYYKDAMDGEVERKIEWLKNNLYLYYDKFNAISFDNLAIKMLDINQYTIYSLINGIKEEWKDIENYEGLYQVSNLGRVKSLKMRSHGKYVDREKILKPTKINEKGYLSVQLQKEQKGKRHLIHRLVAKAFVENDDPINKKYINHIDENITNNTYSNLEWCDNAYNINYGSRKISNSESQFKPVLQYDDNNNLIKTWRSVYEVADAFNCKDSTIRNLCNHKNKKYYHNRIKPLLQYKWEFGERKKTNKKYKNPFDEFYQGDDGTISCYIDAVNQKISKSSLEKETLPLEDDIKTIFKNIKEKFGK